MNIIIQHLFKKFACYYWSCFSY